METPPIANRQWPVFEGAQLAYRDYQGSRVVADDEARKCTLYYDLTYGHTSIFVMDLRSERRA